VRCGALRCVCDEWGFKASASPAHALQTRLLAPAPAGC
jgi:hypothetical protein